MARNTQNHVSNQQRSRRRRQAKKIQRLANSITDRRCDGCTACCTTAGVLELGKPYFTPCRHLADGGCGIYPARPGSCRTYHCFWRLGHGEDTDRPDRVGLVVEPAVLSDGEPCFYAYEVFPSAADQPAGHALLGRLQRACRIILFQHGQCEVGTLVGTGQRVVAPVCEQLRRYPLPTVEDDVNASFSLPMSQGQ